MLKTKAINAAMKLHQYFFKVSPKISGPLISSFSFDISSNSMYKFAMHMATSKMIVAVKCVMKI